MKNEVKIIMKGINKDLFIVSRMIKGEYNSKDDHCKYCKSIIGSSLCLVLNFLSYMLSLLVSYFSFFFLLLGFASYQSSLKS